MFRTAPDELRCVATNLYGNSEGAMRNGARPGERCKFKGIVIAGDIRYCRKHARIAIGQKTPYRRYGNDR